MTTGRINQIATVRGLPKPRECENPKETPLVFVKLSDPPRDEALRFALGCDQMWFCKTELKLRLPGRRSPSVSKRPHPQESWLGGSLAHPLGRRIARGSRTVTLRRTPRIAPSVAAVGGAASRIASHDARSRSNSRHRLSRQLAAGVARELCISKPCDFYCAHCVPTQFFIPVGQSSAWLAAVCE